MKPYQHIKDFTIKYCDVDFKDEMKVSTALAYLEEVACSSADEFFGDFHISFVVTSGFCNETRGTILNGHNNYVNYYLYYSMNILIYHMSNTFKAISAYGKYF